MHFTSAPNSHLLWKEQTSFRIKNARNFLAFTTLQPLLSIFFSFIVAFSLPTPFLSHLAPSCANFTEKRLTFYTTEIPSTIPQQNSEEQRRGGWMWTANKRFQWMKNFPHEHDIIALCNVVWKSVYKRRKSSTKAAKLSEAWNNNWLRLFIQWNLVYSNKTYIAKKKAREKKLQLFEIAFDFPLLWHFRHPTPTSWIGKTISQ